MELIGRVPGLEVDFVVQQTFRSKHANGEDTGRGPARADVPYFGIGKFQKGHGLIVHFGAHGRKFRGHGTSFDDFATEIMQHVELMNGELRKRPAGSTVFVPAPGLGSQLERALVGKIGFDEGHAAKFAAVDGFANFPDAAHESRAVAHGDGDPVFFLQRGNFQSFFESAGDGLFRIDVLAGFRDFCGDRQVLLVGNGEDSAFDLTVRKHGLQVGNRSAFPPNG